MGRILLLFRVLVLVALLSSCGQIPSNDDSYGQLNPPGEPASGDVFGNITEPSEQTTSTTETNSEPIQVVTRMNLSPGG